MRVGTVGRSLLAAALTGLVVMWSGAGPASADGPGRDNDGGPGAEQTGPDSYEATATQVITIEGSTSGGAVIEGTFSPPPPCYYQRGSTGPEMWEDSHDPFLNRLLEVEGIPEDERWPDDLLEHKDDTDGAYWYPLCTSANFPGSIEDFFEYAHAYFDEHDTVWVPDGEMPPNPPVPPSILREYAREFAEVPMPVIEHNPGTEAVVNLDTWVWLTNGSFETVEVTARSGPNWATVTLTPEQLSLSAPNAVQVGSCASGGTVYDLSRPAASQSTDCALQFSRSSAAQPGNVYQVSATTSWSATWTGSDGSGGVLEGATQTATFDLPVAEVQSVVTGTG